MDLTLGDTRLIIDACKRERLLRNEAAYVLATAFHESAHTMKPIEEMGGQAYLRSKPYYPFFGRGYVQLTWEAGYRKASEKLGVDFIGNPALLLQPQYAAPILVIGAKEGWFTGKKLSDYIDLQHSDFVGARRIINGQDRAVLIAGYAAEYNVLLKADGYGENAAPAPQPAPPESVPPAPAPVPQPAPIPPAAQRNPQPVPPKPKVASGLALIIVSAIGVYWHDVAAWVASHWPF